MKFADIINFYVIEHDIIANGVKYQTKIYLRQYTIHVDMYEDCLAISLHAEY